MHASQDQPTPPAPVGRLAKALLSLGVFVVLGLSYAGLLATNFGYGGSAAWPWRQALPVGLIDWGLWWLLTPLVLWLGRRCPLDGRRWWLALLVLLPVSAVLTFLKVGIESALTQQWIAQDSSPFAGGKLHQNGLVWWAILGVGYAIRYYRRYRERELAAAHLQRQLAVAQLDSLRMQLHPHFLFNTLHAVSTLMRRDVDAAERVLARLGDLLRMSLEDHGSHEVSLQRELEFIRTYLEIEQTRFGERLTVAFDVDPQLLGAQVPFMVLQPLVENAIRHGVSKRPAAGRLDVRAARDNGHLVLTVSDDGPGLRTDHASPEPSGVGLRNTRERLQHLYADQHSMSFDSAHGRGLTVKLRVPLRTAPEGQPS